MDAFLSRAAPGNIILMHHRSRIEVNNLHTVRLKGESIVDTLAHLSVALRYFFQFIMLFINNL